MKTKGIWPILVIYEKSHNEVRDCFGSLLCPTFLIQEANLNYAYIRKRNRKFHAEENIDFRNTKNYTSTIHDNHNLQ